MQELNNTFTIGTARTPRNQLSIIHVSHISCSCNQLTPYIRDDVYVSKSWNFVYHVSVKHRNEKNTTNTSLALKCRAQINAVCFHWKGNGTLWHLSYEDRLGVEKSRVFILGLHVGIFINFRKLHLSSIKQFIPPPLSPSKHHVFTPNISRVSCQKGPICHA